MDSTCFCNENMTELTSYSAFRPIMFCVAGDIRLDIMVSKGVDPDTKVGGRIVV